MKVDFEAIKAATDIVSVITGYGVQFKKAGRDYVALCPFHTEQTPSFHVTPEKGLFHCFGCEAKGNVIQFVAMKEGIGEREAAVKLLATVPGVSNGKSLQTATKKTQSDEPKKILKPGEAAALLQRVVNFYVKTLAKDRAGLDYLKSRNLSDAAMLGTFQIGYSNGSLLKVLPRDETILDGLKTLGVLKADGREHFEGCVTVPIFDEQSNVCGIYGRRVNDGEPSHLYLPGPHRGVWNGGSAKTNQTLLIAEAILDGLALWQAGYRNVIALYGTNGWTADHEALFKANPIREVFLCLDNDEGGNKATERLKTELLAEGHQPPLVKAVHVIQWPEGVKDAAEFFLTRNAADFETLLKAANPQPEQPATVSQGEQITMTPTGFIAAYAGRRYECQAIEQPSPARLKATVKAVTSNGRFHIDTVDFYLSRPRRVFIGEAARLWREKVETIEEDMNRLIGQLESYAQKQAENIQAVVLVNDEDKAEGMKLGRHPDLAGEILRDVEKLGLVGEQHNKLMGYLVMTSRKLDDPLALLILSGSGAGKSLLQDTLLKLCPDEDLVKLTSLTDRALFYKGENALRHKALALEEVAGAEGAYYAIRNLISAKKLVIESTVKNPLTGTLTTQVNTVHGPTAVFQTTTQPDVDAETRSRFIITSVDESPEQTKAILEAQRHRHTLEGLRRKKLCEAVSKRHHAFQRLLKPVPVVNPFEPLLSYAEDRLAVRRDNPKYLNLILAVTFLHQMQRAVKHDAESGQDYIETTLGDIAVANQLAAALFGQTLDELSRPSRELLKLIRKMVDGIEKADRQRDGKIIGGSATTFTRRAVREFTGWSDYQVKIHIKQLEELEYLVPISGRRGQSFSYRLAWEGEGLDGERFMPGLIAVEELRHKAQVVGLSSEQVGAKTEVEGRKSKLEGSSRAQVGLNQNGEKPREQKVKSRSVQKLVEKNGERIGARA
jgi:DNA primase